MYKIYRSNLFCAGLMQFSTIFQSTHSVLNLVPALQTAIHAFHAKMLYENQKTWNLLEIAKSIPMNCV